MLDLVALVPVAETLAESVEEVVAALAPTTGVAPSVSAFERTGGGVELLSRPPSPSTTLAAERFTLV
ncbi:MAG: hypothetical protein U1U88_000661 [Lawsonella clevelandensis]